MCIFYKGNRGRASKMGPGRKVDDRGALDHLLFLGFESMVCKKWKYQAKRLDDASQD